MDRHNITKTLRRLAEIREQQARATVTAAHQELDRARSDREALVEERQNHEAQLMRDGAMSGATFQLLELSRQRFQRRLDTVDDRMSDHQSAAEVATDAHRRALGKRRTATKVHEHVHQGWVEDVERRRNQALEELARSRWIAAAL